MRGRRGKKEERVRGIGKEQKKRQKGGKEETEEETHSMDIWPKEEKQNEGILG